MGLSGSYDFTLARREIIKEAYEIIGAIEPDATVSTNEEASAVNSLQLLLKDIQSSGLWLHTYKDCILFLEKDKTQYSLGPSGDNAAEESDVVSTTLSDDHSTSATSIKLTSGTGMANSDKIGIELDDGTAHWTTISSGGGTTTAVVASGVASAAASGKTVYTYTSKIQRPLLIRDTSCRDSNNVDVPVSIVSLSHYRSLSNKQSDGDRPIEVAYDPQLTNGILNVWPRTSNVVNRLVFSMKRPVQNVDGYGQHVEIPTDWLSWFTWELAYKLSFKQPLPLQERMLIRNEADRLKGSLHDYEDTSFFIDPVRRRG